VVLLFPVLVVRADDFAGDDEMDLLPLRPGNRAFPVATLNSARSLRSSGSTLALEARAWRLVLRGG
jgi:hypothetical protein